ncbi:MAG: 2'-5' RNA ligase family protein [Pseudomonadota bacterium]
MNAEPAPIIVSALFGGDDFAYLDGLRRAHFPPDRNVIDAHLTLFHHLPPSIAPELKRRLADETRAISAPAARLGGLMSLGRGVAFRIESPELEAIRDRLADAFAGLLTPQDQQGWRPHVTIQNKVAPADAKRSFADLSRDFRPRRLAISGLASWYYRGGPWEALSTHRFAR